MNLPHIKTFFSCYDVPLLTQIPHYWANSFRDKMADQLVVCFTACLLWLLPVALEAKLTYIAIRLPLKVSAIVPLHISVCRGRYNMGFIKHDKLETKGRFTSNETVANLL